MDSSHHSDLTPLSAPTWTVRAKMAASTSGLAGKVHFEGLAIYSMCVCLMMPCLPSCGMVASRLMNFLKLCYHTEPMNEIAAGGYDQKLTQDETKAADLSQALDKLTQSRMESRLQGRRHFLRSTLQAGVGRLQGMARVRPLAAVPATSNSLAPDELDNLLIVSVCFVWEMLCLGDVVSGR